MRMPWPNTRSASCCVWHANYHSSTFIGGWVEQIGSLLQNDTAVKVGIISSLIIPSETLWKRAVYEMQPPLTSSLFGSPFTATSVPSALMVVYSFIYLVVALTGAIRIFQKRDL
jgi:hypothetical protein